MKNLAPKERIILPLDFPSLKESRPVVEALRDHVGLFKIGWTLFIAEGFHAVREVQALAGDKKVFLDLKISGQTFGDIPHQVGGAAAAFKAGTQGIEFLTVHTWEGEEVVARLVGDFKDGIKVLGVTVLTSSPDSGKVSDEVLRRAKIAGSAGCHGVVCSGHEAGLVKKAHGPDFIVVTPGIRPAWAKVSRDDQRRVMTPREAVLNGADYVVVGRPIYRDKDPVRAAQRVADEIQAALGQA